MPRRRYSPFLLFLWVLGLFLLGTVVVLSSITYYLAIPPSAFISEDEIDILGSGERWNASHHGLPQRIPKILHQTWKTGTLPTRYRGISKECRDMMPDYEYMLWTDESSRDFIADYYPWFLDTFDEYQYSIQRADAIRYFVLYHYGGIYFDIDIGCLRPLDQLLRYPVILPKTIPVGVSNDLMFAEKNHPFLLQTIHNLKTFDYDWVLNYPTVMFSTGPMFLSAQYAIFTSLPLPTEAIRILPKSLYGKNAKEGEAPNSFFSHFYGSSWHSDDAAFIGFLGTWGKGLLWIGLVVLIIGLLRMMLPAKKRRYALQRMGAYEVLLPTRWRKVPTNFLHNHHHHHQTLPVLHLLQSPSDDASPLAGSSRQPPASPILAAFQRVRNRFSRTQPHPPDDDEVDIPLPPTPTRSRRQQQYRRGVLFFLPTIFTSQDPDPDIGDDDLELGSPSEERSRMFSTTSTPTTSLSPSPLTPKATGGGGEVRLVDFGDDPPPLPSSRVGR